MKIRVISSIERINTWIIKIFVLCLVVFVLTLFLSDRISCVLNGHAFAKIVPKDKLVVFDYFDLDGLFIKALVFENDKPIGWICQEWGGGAYFVRYSGRSIEHIPGGDMRTLEKILWVMPEISLGGLMFFSILWGFIYVSLRAAKFFIKSQ